ncbi:zinc finger CCCH domain-containing protein 39-like, partial [Trifolium medium]|nr:zinc finger CCCH domain-containing protein 39-like [Trifolium medium]
INDRTEQHSGFEQHSFKRARMIGNNRSDVLPCPPPRVGNWDDDQKIIHKMKLCKKFYNGEQCPYGEKCSFLHEDPAKFRADSWKSRECSAISIGTVGSPKSFGDGSDNLEGNSG